MLILSISGFLTFLNSSIFLFGYISSSNLFPEPLSNEEEKIYIDKLESGDINAKNVLIERNLRLVAHISKKYVSQTVSLDDLISIGTIGLIKGVNSYNSKKGVKLSTYISRCIENAHLTLWNYMQYFKQHINTCKIKLTPNTQ